MTQVDAQAEAIFEMFNDARPDCRERIIPGQCLGDSGVVVGALEYRITARIRYARAPLNAPTDPCRLAVMVPYNDLPIQVTYERRRYGKHAAVLDMQGRAIGKFVVAANEISDSVPFLALKDWRGRKLQTRLAETEQ